MKRRDNEDFLPYGMLVVAAIGLIAVTLVAILGGCQSQSEPEKLEKTVNRTSVGKILNARTIPGSWSNTIRMEITCERIVVVVRHGTPCVSLGEEAVIITKNDGSKWITWKSTDHLWRVQQGRCGLFVEKKPEAEK